MIAPRLIGFRGVEADKAGASVCTVELHRITIRDAEIPGIIDLGSIGGRGRNHAFRRFWGIPIEQRSKGYEDAEDRGHNPDHISSGAPDFPDDPER